MWSRSHRADHLLADLQGDKPCQPAAPPLAPSNQLNGIHTFHWRHKEDKLSQVSNLSPHEDYHPCPGTSLSITISVSPLPSHTALSVCSTSYGWTPLYISRMHTVRQSHSWSFMRASGPSNKSPVFSSQADWGKEEDYSAWLDFALAGSVTMHFLDCEVFLIIPLSKVSLWTAQFPVVLFKQQQQQIRGSLKIMLAWKQISNM